MKIRKLISRATGWFLSAAMCITGFAGIMPATAIAATEDESTVVTYDVQSCHSESTVASMTVNGEKVPIIAFLANYDHAQFSFDGTANIEITVNETIETYSVSPLAKNIEATASGNKLSFSITESIYMIVKINGIKEIIIVADELETDVPASSGEGIYNIVTDYNADPTGAESVVEALQSAIDDANAAGGGTVYVPSGLYKLAGNIMLKSNVDLYLEGGAVIRGVTDRTYYANHTYKSSISKDITWLFYTEVGAENIKIYGRGMIDANGSKLYGLSSSNSMGVTALMIRYATNFSVDGITVRDGSFWTVFTRICQDLSFTNFKILNDFDGMTENDAIDICESQRVNCSHMLAISEDDTFSTKAYTASYLLDGEDEDAFNNGDKTVMDVTFDDCFGWTHCGTFKVGDGSYNTQQNITFKNSYSYKCMQALKITHTYGTGAYKNIVFDNIDIESYGGRSTTERRWLWVSSSDSYTGDIDGLTFRNINIRDIGKNATLGGSSKSTVKNVTFENITIPSQTEYAGSLKELNITDTNSYVSGITFLPTASDDLTAYVRYCQRKYTDNALNAYTVATADLFKSALEAAVTAMESGEGTSEALTALKSAESTLLKKTVDSSKNLAKGRVVYVSGVQNDSSGAAKAVDGSTGSYWRSQTSGSPYWLTVDLGAKKNFDYIYIYWEACYATQFKLRVSDDNENWTDIEVDDKVWLTTYSSGGQSIYTDEMQSGRYIQMYALGKASSYGCGIGEIEVYDTTDVGENEDLGDEIVYGDPSVNLAKGKNVYASGVQNDNSAAKNAVDGSYGSCWRSQTKSGGGAPYWLAIDLGSMQAFDTIVLDWEYCYATSYTIEISEDYVNWSAVQVGGASMLSGVSDGTQTLTLDTQAKAQFVRMYATAKSAGWMGGDYGLGLYEFEVYNKAVKPIDVKRPEGTELITSLDADLYAAYGEDTLENAVDGDAETAWTAATGSSGKNTYFLIDLGEETTFDTIYIDWGSEYPKTYQLQQSHATNTDDAINNFDATCGSTDESPRIFLEITGSVGGVVLHELEEPITCRFLRIWCKESTASPSVYSIDEIAVFNLAADAEKNAVKAAGNLALNKTATASSVRSNDRVADLMLDGISTNASRWERGEATKKENQWVIVDLEDVYAVDTVLIKWENLPLTYSITGSVTGEDGSWTTIAASKTPDGQPFLTDESKERYMTVDTFSTQYIRYIKVDMSPETTKYYLSIMELEVYGMEGVSLIPDSTAVLSTPASGSDASYAIDGDFSTSATVDVAADESWFYLDLGEIKSFDTINIHWAVSAADYEIQVSNLIDGTCWTAVANDTTTGGSAVYKELSLDNAVNARYIRIYAVDGATGMSIKEIEAYCAGNSTKFELVGAQYRENAQNETAYDLRFVTRINADFFNAIAEDTTELGTIIVRADQLEAADLRQRDINLELFDTQSSYDGLTVKKIQAAYLNNSMLEDGEYAFVNTIIGIAEDASAIEYIAVSYITYYQNGELTTVYTAPAARSVAYTAACVAAYVA